MTSQEQTPPQIPIEQAIKNILLEKRQVPSWLKNVFVGVSLKLTGDYSTNLIEEKPVYKTLWSFSEMTPDEIRKLNEQELGRILSMLDTEDQDYLEGRLPSNLAKGFWCLVEKYDFMKESD